MLFVQKESFEIFLIHLHKIILTTIFSYEWAILTYLQEKEYTSRPEYSKQEQYKTAGNEKKKGEIGPLWLSAVCTVEFLLTNCWKGQKITLWNTVKKSVNIFKHNYWNMSTKWPKMNTELTLRIGPPHSSVENWCSFDLP